MWKDLKCILLSEVNQCEKATYCMIQLKGPGLPQDWYYVRLTRYKPGGDLMTPLGSVIHQINSQNSEKHSITASEETCRVKSRRIPNTELPWLCPMAPTWVTLLVHCWVFQSGNSPFVSRVFSRISLHRHDVLNNDHVIAPSPVLLVLCGSKLQHCNHMLGLSCMIIPHPEATQRLTVGSLISIT